MPMSELDDQLLPSDSFVAVIMGPSGVGKDTLVREMQHLSELPRLHLNDSWTTRQRRRDEPEDLYHFASEEEYLEAEAKGKFLQTNKKIYGKWYATPFPRKLPEDTVETFILVAESALKVKEYFSDTKIYLIEPPSLAELRQRLEGRGVYSFVDLERREHAADSELRAGRAIADHRIVNETGKQKETARRLHHMIKVDWQAASDGAQ